MNDSVVYIIRLWVGKFPAKFF